MINRKVAKRGLQDDGFWETIEANEKLIDDIYDSLGSCGGCKYYKLSGYTPKGDKKAPDICAITLTGQPKEHFCADFERKGE